MQTLLLYSLLSASLFYLGSRAVITSWLWSRYPYRLAAFMDCAACSGTWYGAALAYVGGHHLGLSFMGFSPDSWAAILVAALVSTSTTPIVAGLVQRGFDTLGKAVSDPEPTEPPHEDQTP